MNTNRSTSTPPASRRLSSDLRTQVNNQISSPERPTETSRQQSWGGGISCRTFRDGSKVQHRPSSTLRSRPSVDRTSSIRRHISLSIKQPHTPPPLCSVCKHAAPVFGKPPRKFSYEEIQKATNVFSPANYLAEGGFGPVYKGVLDDGQVVAVKKQTLRHEFETLHMKSNESVQEFMSRVVAIVNQMRIYGDKMVDEIVVMKVLRSLAPRFDHVVAAIEESKDLSSLTLDELSGSLHAHEARINRYAEKLEDKAFQVRGEPVNARDGDKSLLEGVEEARSEVEVVVEEEGDQVEINGSFMLIKGTIEVTFNVTIAKNTGI